MANNSVFDKLFMAIGVVLTFIVGILTDCDVLSLISAIAGVVSVVLCSQRKISFYTFGFIQIFTYSFICYNEGLYGKLLENAFYLITMIIGLYGWIKHYDNNIKEVETKYFKHPFRNEIIINVSIVIFTCLMYHPLKMLNDTNPLLDAFSTTVAFIAQILMILRYRESWYYWMIVNIFCAILWINAGDYCMTIQYIFWMANCFFGFSKWNRK